MCGICGSTFDPDRTAVDAMSCALRHRGPDDHGSYLDPGGTVALAARRLSVIDPQGGTQPRANETGGVWAMLNGEIYNRPALRRHLAGRHELRGSSDTELLPHLYEEYGDELPQALEGMFAFAIWDADRGRLLLGRDRFGEKPLFYARQGEHLLFASELTALVAGLRSRPEPDPAAFDAFFVLGYVPGSAGSILEGVRQLAPGHTLAWERGSGELSERSYWTAPAAVTPTVGSPAELAAETGRLLEASVRDRLRADVPLGVFLSGGVDSTLAAAIAAAGTNGRLRTFTVGYGAEDGGDDERAAARRVAAMLDSDHREIELREADAAATVPELLAALDQPLADAAVVPLNRVARLARETVKVGLGGEGADELFGGYPRYAWFGRSPWRTEAMAALGGFLPSPPPGSSRPRRGIDLLIPRRPSERHLEWVTGGRRKLLPLLYGPRLRGELTAARVPRRLAAALDRLGGPSPAALMRLDRLDWLPDDVLAKADRAAMQASLELRTPYLQRELAEFAAGLDPAIHLRGGGKQLLRILLAQRLPGAPTRRKVAFLPPVAAWLRGGVGATLAAQIDGGSLYREGWIDPLPAAAMLAEHRAGKADHSGVLWPLLAAGLWLDRYRGGDAT